MFQKTDGPAATEPSAEPSSEDSAREDLRQLSFAITETQGGNGGALRVPPRAQAYLLHSLTGRTRALPGLARQAVRLAVALDRVGPRGYIHALHGGLPVLRTSAFRAFFSGATGPEVACEGDRLVLSGPGLEAERGGAFTIELTRLPLVAAYLDATHLMLGFGGLAARLAPALDGGAAEPVAAALHADVSGWLDARLQREHLARQVQVIRGFMMDRGVRGAEEVDNEAILAFWLQHGVEETRIDGFRMWRNAARQVMAYRIALRDAARDTGIEAPLGIDAEEGVDLSRHSVEEIETGHWTSPLDVLTAPPADAVKWLSGKDIAGLSSLLPAKAVDAQGNDAPDDTLFAGARPEMGLLMTWLRVEAFGRQQAQLVDTLRKGTSAAVTATPYEAITTRFVGYGAALRRVREACTWELLRRTPMHGLSLALDLDREAVLAAFPPRSDANEEPRPPGPAEIEAAAEALRDRSNRFGARCRAAYSGVNRAGFRPSDAEDEEIGEGLRVGAPWLKPLAQLLGELEHWSDRQDLATAFSDDRPRFEAAFARLYPDRPVS